MKHYSNKIIVIPLLIAALGAGGYFGIPVLTAPPSVKVAPVYEVQSQSKMWGFTELGVDTYYGKLKKGSVISIKPDPTLTIKEVMVKKGDTVKKGDLLITYDTHDLEDNISDAELAVNTLKNEIAIIDNELAILKVLQPSENKPQEVTEEPEEPEEETDSDTESDSDNKKDSPDEPVLMFERKLTASSMPMGGSGTQDDPLIFAAGEYTVVSKELLGMLAQSETPVTAAFYVCSEEGAQLYARVIDSSKLTEENIADFPLSDGVTVSPTGAISFSGGAFNFASFVMMSASAAADMPQPGEMPEMPEMPEEDINAQIEEYMAQMQAEAEAEAERQKAEAEEAARSGETYELSLNDHYMYSLQELKDMIAEREKQRAALDLQMRQSELTAKRARQLSENGGETSTIDGKVTFVAKDIRHLSDSGAYITITNTTGMSVTASVSEFALDTLEVNQGVSVSDMQSMGSVSGTITWISDTASSENVGSYADNMMGDTTRDMVESFYDFTVELSEDLDLEENGNVVISTVFDNDDAVTVMREFVRAEGGKNYVYVKGANDLLEKRYVTIGDSDYMSILITEGLSKDDYIAFPYGKAADGVLCKDSDFTSVYYGSLLY